MLLIGIALLTVVSLTAGQANSNCECIAYFYCTNRTQITDVICEYTSEVCCQLEPEPEPPVPFVSNCGVRGNSSSSTEEPSIIWKIFDTTGDTDTSFGEFPWMVAVMKVNTNTKEQKFLCGGSVINPNVILTAAHTVSDLSPSELNVKAGIWNTTDISEMDKHQDRSVTRIVMHPEFSKRKVANDVALLILNEPLKITENVAPVCLPTQGEYNRSNCIATGWGADNFGSITVQSVLKKVMLPLIDFNTCQNKLREHLGSKFNLHNSFICAWRDGADTCKGDGGGPLMCPTVANPNVYVQVGITAWGVGCTKNYPGAYSSVAAASDWIEKEVGKAS